jgi:hypothetical protein
MLRKALFGSFVMALAMVPSFAKADFQAGNWELTLGGSGASNKSVSQGTFAANGSLGYFLTKDFEVAIRQSVGYADFNNGTQWTGSTRVAADYHFDLGNWKPFIGGNLGYVYGGGNDSWEVAPEAGVKFFLNTTTFIFGMAEYQMLFSQGHHASFEKGSFVYSLGLGVILK